MGHPHLRYVTVTMTKFYFGQPDHSFIHSVFMMCVHLEQDKLKDESRKMPQCDKYSALQSGDVIRSKSKSISKAPRVMEMMSF